MGGMGDQVSDDRCFMCGIDGPVVPEDYGLRCVDLAACVNRRAAADLRQLGEAFPAPSWAVLVPEDPAGIEANQGDE